MRRHPHSIKERTSHEGSRALGLLALTLTIAAGTAGCSGDDDTVGATSSKDAAIRVAHVADACDTWQHSRQVAGTAGALNAEAEALEFDQAIRDDHEHWDWDMFEVTNPTRVAQQLAGSIDAAQTMALTPELDPETFTMFRELTVAYSHIVAITLPSPTTDEPSSALGQLLDDVAATTTDLDAACDDPSTLTKSDPVGVASSPAGHVVAGCRRWQMTEASIGTDHALQRVLDALEFDLSVHASGPRYGEYHDYIVSDSDRVLDQLRRSSPAARQASQTADLDAATATAFGDLASSYDNIADLAAQPWNRDERAFVGDIAHVSSAQTELLTACDDPTEIVK